ncbi:hypothetical protein ACH4T9_04355 [Micromonospora sp. NPDC020750]|uniref:hypothetical protein n=2 Tax=Micromonospora TaxID=1873 RepID=UPI00378B9C32
MDDQPSRDSGLEVPLSWLADAPLFIDGEQVSAFYDAVVMPENEAGKISISTKDIRLSRTSTNGKLGARIGTRELLAAIFPFLDAQISLEGSRGREKSKQAEDGDTIELHPISNPHRQLVQLALHYAAHLPSRVRFAQDEMWLDDLDEAYIKDSPRALVFFDLPARRAIIPLAAELTTGKVVAIFEELATEVSKTVRTLPPTYAATEEPETKREYWRWFSDNYNPISAMNVLERGIGDGGLARWVDYRVHIEDRALQLSLRGRGKFETGIFAYSMIRRGNQHGLRIVGTLKSGPGLNVLAVFEK